MATQISTKSKLTVVENTDRAELPPKCVKQRVLKFRVGHAYHSYEELENGCLSKEIKAIFTHQSTPLL